MTQELPHMRPTAQRPLNGQTLLIVDDSRYASEAFRLMARYSGARVRRADSIASAQRHLGHYRPQAMIVDLGLPDGDGTHLIDQMHHASIRPNVILGRSGDIDRKADVLKAGAQGFLTKPVPSLAAFQNAIVKHLPATAQLKLRETRPDIPAAPDRLAFQEDLAEARHLMAQDPSESDTEYLANFVLGIAKIARDTHLKDAAENLSRSRAEHSPQEGLKQLFHLVHDRLQERAPI